MSDAPPDSSEGVVAPVGQPDRKFDAAVVFGLIVVCALIYYPVAQFEFLDYDDVDYIQGNPDIADGFTWSGVVAAFSNYYNSSWHPLAIISHMIDIELFGLNAGAHHLVSVLFHLVNSILLFFVLRRITGLNPESALVALLFAAHPLHVEPVAWLASRKDMISTLFLILVVAAHARYTRTRSPLWYIAVCLLFVCGLLSKPTLIPLPCGLLLLDYWPLARVRDAGTALRCAAEKVPLLLLSILCSSATLAAQSTTWERFEDVSLLPRAINVIHAYGFYLRTTFVPTGLNAFYPFRGTTDPLWSFALSLVVILGITLLSVAWWKRHPYIITGWLWFLGMMVPVSGIMQFNLQGSADRYTYVPHVGLFIAMVWPIGYWLRKNDRITVRVRASLAVAVVMMYTLLSAGQISHWRNDRTVFHRVLAVGTHHYVPHLFLGMSYYEGGNIEESIFHYEAAAAIDDTLFECHNNLAIAYGAVGDLEKAERSFVRAAELRPDQEMVKENLERVRAELAARANSGIPDEPDAP